MDFGFTNDAARYEAVIAWRDAAIADGWSARATYEEHESIDSATTLECEGFKASVIARTKQGKWAYQASVSAWGPDGLAIRLPVEYDWQAALKAVRTCNYCGAIDVEVSRVGFAGRCCNACMPAVRALIERAGWDL